MVFISNRKQSVIRIAFTISISLLFIYCSNDQEEPVIEPIKEDTSVPVISISALNPVVEKRTNLTISVSGVEEETTTTVLINEQELVATTQKSFEFELNPFDFPNGETVMTVKSVTAGGKESVKNEEFEINKLLLKAAGGFSSDLDKSFIAINLQSTGELIAFREIVTENDWFFYAEDGFTEEELIVTQYRTSDNVGLQVAIMYGGVQPGTEVLTFNEEKQALGLDNLSINKTASLNLTLEGFDTRPNFSSLAGSYSFGSSTASEIEILFDEVVTKDVFMYSYNFSNTNVANNYRYVYVDSLSDQILMPEDIYVAQVEDVRTVELPTGVENAGISLLGYSSDYDYQHDLFHLLYSNSMQTEQSGFSLEYPIVKEYPIVYKSLNMTFSNGISLSTSRVGDPEFNVPQPTIEVLDSLITIDKVYDVVVIERDIPHPDPGKTDVIRFIYRNLNLQTVASPFKTFEIPAEILQRLNEKGFEIPTNSLPEDMRLVLTEYENDAFLNGVFSSIKLGLLGDSNKWTIPVRL